MTTAHYIVIYRPLGVNALADGLAPQVLLESEQPEITATLVEDALAHTAHIDRSAALGALLLKGLFAPDREGTADERIAAETNAIRLARVGRIQGRAFIVFAGVADVPSPDYSVRRDRPDFAVALDAIAKRDIRELFQPTVRAVLAALGLSLPTNADPRFERIGDVIYLTEEDGKPIYTFNLEAGAITASVASPLTNACAAQAAVLAQQLASAADMARPVSLLLTALDKETAPLQGFIAAWAGLEIFVNVAFKAVYEARWFAIMENGAPGAAAPVLERFRAVMRDKYRLADKFLVIASVLDPDRAEEDHAAFLAAKAVRDNLFHGQDNGREPFPTADAYGLLMKYLYRHLSRPSV